MEAMQELAGYKVGDLVRLPRVDVPLVVVGFDGQSLLVLRSPSGAVLKAGWKVVERDRSTAAPVE